MIPTSPETSTEQRAEMETVSAPLLWDFTGWLSGHTHYTVRLIGKPTAKSLEQLITTLQLYHGFMIEDERSDAVSSTHVAQEESPSDVGTKTGEKE